MNIDAQIDDLRSRNKTYQKCISDNDKKITELLAEKAKLAQKPKVSDHAVLRYIERHLNIDVESIRGGLLTPQVISAMNIGCTGYKFNGGTLKFNGKTVTTYIE